jgi:hypothetical protein
MTSLVISVTGLDSNAALSFWETEATLSARKPEYHQADDVAAKNA